MTSPTRPEIVVGVSCSRASAGALRWAAAEAERRHVLLRVVHAWSHEPRAPYAPSGTQGTGAGPEHASQDLAAILEAVLGPAQCGTAAIVRAEVVEGTAERALLDRSAGADLLVLGSAYGSLSARSIGPVIRACMSRARCPVVVVGPGEPSGRDAGLAAGRSSGVRDYGRDLEPAGLAGRGAGNE